MNCTDQHAEVIPELEFGELLGPEILDSLTRQLEDHSPASHKVDHATIDPVEGLIRPPAYVGEEECLEIIAAIYRHQLRRGLPRTRCQLTVDHGPSPFDPSWHPDSYDQFTLSTISTEGLSGRISTLPHEKVLGAITREAAKSRDLKHLDSVEIARAQPGQLVKIPALAPHRSPDTPRLWVNIRPSAA